MSEENVEFNKSLVEVGFIEILCPQCRGVVGTAGVETAGKFAFFCNRRYRVTTGRKSCESRFVVTFTPNKMPAFTMHDERGERRRYSMTRVIGAIHARTRRVHEQADRIWYTKLLR